MNEMAEEEGRGLSIKQQCRSVAIGSNKSKGQMPRGG